MKIPFDIKYRDKIESGEYKVETRDGRPVRIVCYDRKYGYPIMALATEADGHEIYVNCNFDGRESRIYEWPADLFIVTPEEEMTEFEKAVGDIIKEAVEKEVGDNAAIWAIGRGHTEKLLDLARKEITPSFGKEYETGYLDGMNDTLKNLPRWRKCAPCDKDCGEPPAWIVRFDAERETESVIVHDRYYISLGDLEKLPGFNE